ncbi:MAG: FAD-binding oxidoreductase, partial [Pseudomonadota bacterium]
MSKLARRAVLLGAGGALGWFGAKRFSADLPVYDGTNVLTQATGDTILNDASGLSATSVQKHIIVSADPGEALLDAVRAEMAEARSEGRPFNIG